MTPTLLLQLFAILAGGACFIAFLVIVLVLVSKLIAPQDHYTTEEKKSAEKTTQVMPNVFLNDQELKVYTSGVTRGLAVVHIGIFKCWKDNNEVPLIASFDELKEDINKNLESFGSDNKLLVEWTDKYNEHFKTLENNK